MTRRRTRRASAQRGPTTADTLRDLTDQVRLLTIAIDAQTRALAGYVAQIEAERAEARDMAIIEGPPS